MFTLNPNKQRLQFETQNNAAQLLAIIDSRYSSRAAIVEACNELLQLPYKALEQFTKHTPMECGKSRLWVEQKQININKVN